MKDIISISRIIFIFKMTLFTSERNITLFQRFSVLGKIIHRIQIIRLSTGITVQNTAFHLQDLMIQEIKICRTSQ